MFKDYRFWLFFVFTMVGSAIIDYALGLTVLFKGILLVIYGAMLEYEYKVIVHVPLINRLPWIKRIFAERLLHSMEAGLDVTRDQHDEIQVSHTPRPWRYWRFVGGPDGVDQMVSVAKVLARYGGVRLAEAHDIIGKLAVTYASEKERCHGVTVYISPSDEQSMISALADLEVTATPVDSAESAS